MAVRLEPGVRKSTTALPKSAAPGSEAASGQAWRPQTLPNRAAAVQEAAVSAEYEPEDRLRTARGILFGLAISLAAWICAGLIWWAI